MAVVNQEGKDCHAPQRRELILIQLQPEPAAADLQAVLRVVMIFEHGPMFTLFSEGSWPLFPHL